MKNESQYAKKSINEHMCYVVCDWYFQSYLGLRISLVNHLESVLVLSWKTYIKMHSHDYGLTKFLTKLENQESTKFRDDS